MADFKGENYNMTWEHSFVYNLKFSSKYRDMSKGEKYKLEGALTKSRKVSASKISVGTAYISLDEIIIHNSVQLQIN